MHIIVLITFISIVLCYGIARAQYKSVSAAIIWALILGPLAIPVVLFVLKKKNKNEEQ